jgi:hypothetical protein
MNNPDADPAYDRITTKTYDAAGQVHGYGGPGRPDHAYLLRHAEPRGADGAEPVELGGEQRIAADVE